MPILAAALAPASCASIWGFEDALDRDTDGGTAPGPSGLDPSTTPGVVCVPPVPEGFQGPLAIYEAPGTPALPDCNAKFTPAYDVAANPDGPPGGCSCACEPQGQYTCANPVLTLFTDATCNTPCGPIGGQPVPAKNGNTCLAIDRGSCPTTTYEKLSDAKPSGAPCVPKTVDPPAPFKWGGSARLCSAISGIVTASCPPGKIAAPAPELPFNAGNLCIASSSQDVCPPDYPAKRTFYDPKQLVDERSCKACSCSEPKGACGGSFLGSDKSDCTGGTRVVPVPSTACTKDDLAKDSTTSFAYTPAGPATGVTCEASGGGSQGGLATGKPLTVCCRL